MARLKLAFLDTFRVTLDSQPVTRFRSHRSKGLLVYLALQSDRPFPREVLATLFWPEETESAARNNLRQAVYQLRKVLGDLEHPEEPFLLATRQTVQFNSDSDFYLDVNHFWQSIERGEPETAVAIYHGDLLPGFTLDSLQFEDWLRHVREQLHQAALKAMSEVAQGYLQAGRLAKAQAAAHQQLLLEPWRESAHRQLMQAYAQAGDRGNALAQFETCRAVLWDELGVEPAQETAALYESIKSGDFGPTDTDEVLESSVEARHNLPTYATPFIGREAELAKLDGFIVNPNVRLVTIVGLGGIGKTRLAIAAGERSLAARIFPDGLFFIDLAPLQETGQILEAAANALNFPFKGEDGPSSKRHLLDYLRKKRMLFIFDNFEHLLDGATLLAEILRAGPAVKILATSRERLQLTLEQVVPIDGLAIPDLGVAKDAAAYAAARLFLQSARRNDPGFALHADDFTHLAQISRLVAGMPLALELAASWVDKLTLDEIEGELRKSLDILKTDMRDVPERQRSVRASFDYSWRRLDELEQAVFAQLSIFRGGFKRAAALEVTNASLHQLSYLVNKSLIRFDKGHGRYQIHELLRQYGAEKLAEQPELKAFTADRHSSYYLQLLAGYTDDLKGRGQLQAMSAIEADYDNVLLAWNHASAQQDIEAIGMSLESLWRFYWNSGKREFQEIEKAVADFRKGEAIGARGIVLGRLLAPLGRSYGWRGDTAKAREMLEESLDLLQRWGAAEERLVPLLFLAEVQGSLEESNRLYREGLVLARATGDRWAIGHALLFLGWNAQFTGDYQEAEQQFHGALEQFRQTGDMGGITTLLAVLSTLAVDRGRYEDALAFSRESMSAADGFNPLVPLMGLIAKAQALYALGAYEEAEKLFGQGLRVYREYGREDDEEWLFWLGEIAFSRMDYARAAQLYEDSFASAVEFRNLQMVIRIHASQGSLFAAQGKAIEARKQLHAALQSAIQSNWRPLLLDCLAASAAFFAKEGNLEYAAQLAALVTAEPASRAMTRERGERLLAHVEKELSWDPLGAVSQGNQMSDLGAVAAHLLLELDTP